MLHYLLACLPVCLCVVLLLAILSCLGHIQQHYGTIKPFGATILTIMTSLHSDICHYTVADIFFTLIPLHYRYRCTPADELFHIMCLSVCTSVSRWFLFLILSHSLSNSLPLTDNYIPLSIRFRSLSTNSLQLLSSSTPCPFFYRFVRGLTHTHTLKVNLSPRHRLSFLFVYFLCETVVAVVAIAITSPKPLTSLYDTP